MRLEEVLANLLGPCYKIALEMGEDWRLRHAEFMDALSAAQEELLVHSSQGVATSVEDTPQFL